MQVLGVGTVALMSHAVGRKDRTDASLIFNQAIVLSVLFGLLTLVVGALLARPYMRAVAADEATVEAGTTFLLWIMPALALQFVTQVMGAGLRATGIVRPTMLVQVFAVIINIALAPVLIAGWGTGHAFGVAGAGLASSIAVLIAALMLLAYFHRFERYVGFEPAQWRPRFREWKRIVNVGLPAGGEFAIIFAWMGVIYYVLRDFGAAAQAGFGIGTRVLGLIQMPALAVALAAAPIVGQNFGAGNGERVRETFAKALAIATVIMIGFTVLAQWKAGLLLAGFSEDREAIAVAVQFLQLVSLNLVVQGVTFTCNATFQGLGNTKPVLLSSGSRLLFYAVPAIWLSTRPGFFIEQVWYLSIATTTLQAALSLWLLRREFRKRLAPLQGKVSPEPVAAE
jgi:putative MATE family efflux protein